MGDYFRFVLTENLRVIPHWSCSPRRPCCQIKLSSFLLKTELLGILSTDPLRVTFHAYFVFLLGINLYLVPSLFCGGLTSEGVMRILEVIKPHSPSALTVAQSQRHRFKKGMVLASHMRRCGPPCLRGTSVLHININNSNTLKC